MEGIEKTTQEMKHNTVSVGLDSQVCHFMSTSEMHQKLGTFSW